MVGRRALLAAAIALCAALSAAMAPQACAQAYPDKPIKLIVTVAPGGPMDTIARFVGQQMQIKLGQPVVVENRAGAGATLGAKAVAVAEPDGYTLMWGTLSVVAIAPVLYKDPGYDPKAFEMVGNVAEFPHVVVVPASLPVSTLAEFIAYAKAHRGGINFGGSLGTPPQLLGSLFSKIAGLDMTYVPYKGGAPSLADLMSGRLQMQFDALTLLQPLVKEGKLKALAVVTPRRWPALPDVPTMAEAGFPNFPSAPWGGIMAPPHTPKPIVERLNAELRAALALPDVQAKLKEGGNIATPTTPEEMRDQIAGEIANWKQLIETNNIKVQ